jgi:RimJ/RimL family protein N-acetyltransferase
MPATPVLETSRLWLCPASLAEAPLVQRYFADWAIVEHLPNTPWPYPPDGAMTNALQCLEEMRRGAKSHWSLYRRDQPGELIGRISLWPDDGRARDMRGFWLAPEYQGQGFMTEAAERVTTYALCHLGWPRLWLSNLADNHRSAAVKRRQGAKFIEEVDTDYLRGRLRRQIWLIQPS